MAYAPSLRFVLHALQLWQASIVQAFAHVHARATL